MNHLQDSTVIFCTVDKNGALTPNIDSLIMNVIFFLHVLDKTTMPIFVHFQELLQVDFHVLFGQTDVSLIGIKLCNC